MQTEFIMPYTETKERSDKFAQSFDRKKITLTKAGQTFNLYDYIQAQREDTEIYPTLEKYGNLEIISRPATEVFADVSDAMDLRSLYDQDRRLNDIFEGLPLKEREYFNHDFYKFKENGLKYYEEKAKNEIKQKQTETEQKNIPPSEGK